MNKLLIPTFYAKNLFDIDVNFFTLLNIKYIFADLDNTLDSYKEEVASKRVIDYVTLLKKNEINLIIVSNNSNKRVEKYAHSINIPYLYKCYKPFTKKINKYILTINFYLLLLRNLYTALQNVSGVSFLLSVTNPLCDIK